jgi:NYN domain
MAQKLRTSVYVDGFNLYYGSLRKTNYKWLDILKLSQLYFPNNTIASIKYFTAIISARASDPQQPARQNAYFRALGTIPCLEIIHGHYLSHTVRARLANPPVKGNKFVDIIKTEEKGSDVNLATHLLHDAHLDCFDIAVVISNDSDLLMPIKLVRSDLGKKVGILNPQVNPSRALLPHTDFMKQIRGGALLASQFPNQIIDSGGSIITKPANW